MYSNCKRVQKKHHHRPVAVHWKLEKRKKNLSRGKIKMKYTHTDTNITEILIETVLEKDEALF